MKRLVPNAKHVVAGVMVAGALSLTLGGVVGVSAAGADPAPLTFAPKVGPNFDCNRATKALTRIEYTESQISSGFPAVKKAEGKAKAEGRTKEAHRLQKRLTRLEKPRLKSALAVAAQKIEAECHVSAPPPPSS